MTIRTAALDAQELNIAGADAHFRVAFHAWPSLGRDVLQAAKLLAYRPYRATITFISGAGQNFGLLTGAA
jgi:hypothetical protein